MVCPPTLVAETGGAQAPPFFYRRLAFSIACSRGVSASALILVASCSSMPHSVVSCCHAGLPTLNLVAARLRWLAAMLRASIMSSCGSPRSSESLAIVVYLVRGIAHGKYSDL